MIDTKVEICGVTFKNPVTTASGTFGSGKEYSEFIDLNRLGAVTVKGVASSPWQGNPTPRIAEVYGGMLNAIGLQNGGAANFLKDDLVFLEDYDTKVIINVCGHTVQEYVDVVEMLNDSNADMYELNISCPNVTEGGIAFGTDPCKVAEVVSSVKKVSKKPLIVKLSPNVTDVVLIAKTAVDAGADALSLINTLQGMKIDINRRKAVLANKIGGFSGPAIKPVAVRMVYQVANAVNVPIIGMGGISNYEDALEFIMAGATMVAVGTANFINPHTTIEIIDGLEGYMKENNIKNLSEIRGIV